MFDLTENQSLWFFLILSDIQKGGGIQLCNCKDLVLIDSTIRLSSVLYVAFFTVRVDLDTSDPNIATSNTDKV